MPKKQEQDEFVKNLIKNCEHQHSSVLAPILVSGLSEYRERILDEVIKHLRGRYGAACTMDIRKLKKNQ